MHAFGRCGLALDYQPSAAILKLCKTVKAQKPRTGPHPLEALMSKNDSFKYIFRLLVHLLRVRLLIALSVIRLCCNRHTFITYPLG